MTGLLHSHHPAGGSATTIELDSLVPAPLGDFSDVLSSRIPGVLVEQPSGVTGAGARIHIRGINSLILPGDPLVIVDGVRVAKATTMSTVNVGGQAPSRLDDLDPEEIERIEVLPGPASAALYGGDAADGVILITTRHGQPGRPTWRLHSQYGVLNEVTDYPANFRRAGTDPVTGQPVASCTLDLASQGGCIPGALTFWNPLENVSPFHTGTKQRHGLSVDGGDRTITYHAAGDYEWENGVYADNDRQQTHLRANVTGHLGSTLALTLNTSYGDGMVRLPIGGDSFLNVIGAGLLGEAADDSTTRGYARIPPFLGYPDGPVTLFHSTGAAERMYRSTIGANAEWHVLPWLRSVSTVGFDHVHLSSDDRHVFLPQRGDSAINRTTAAYRSDILTVQSEWQASYGHATSLSASSSIGVRYHRQRVHWRYQFEGKLFSSGRSTPLTDRASAQSTPDASTTGLYVQQHFSWRGRLAVEGGLRRDRNYRRFFSSVGEAPTATDVSASLSWLLGSEPFFPHPKWLDALRVRAAYGSTARFLDEATTLPPVLGSNSFTLPLSGFSHPVVGAQVPDRTHEIEAGVDAALFHGRLNAALTYYDRHSTQHGVGTAAPLTGAEVTVIVPDAVTIHNRGYELMLSTSVVRTRAVSGNITVAGATNRNIVDRHADPLSSSGLSMSGYPAAGFWGRRIRFADADGNGIITRNEVQVGDSRVFLGNAIPTRELSIVPALRLFGRLELSALFDYRGGFKQRNENEASRCTSSITSSNCRAMYDPTAPVADQAAAIAVAMGSADGYVQDAAFWKVREVALRFTVPQRWARELSMHDVSVTLAGRNLATWTTYRGLDPEINMRPSVPLSQTDFFTQPPVRYLTARLDVMW